MNSPPASDAPKKMSVSKAEAVKQIKAYKEKEAKVSSMAAKVKERKAMRLLKTLVAVRRAKKAAQALKQFPLVKNLTDAENSYLIKYMKSTPTDAVMVLSGNLSDASPSTVKVYKKFYGKVELPLPFNRTYIYHDKSKKQLLAQENSGYHG